MRYLLLAAFVISLIVHVIVAMNLHPTPMTPPDEATHVTILRRAMIALKHPPTPSPRPKATPVPHPAPPKRVASKPHAQQPAGNGAGGTGRAAQAPSAAPSPVSTAVNGCLKTDLEAAIAETPPQPDIPVAARASGTSGVAEIKVELDAQGAVTGTSVSASSGNAALDRIAASLARQAKYTPAMHDCKGVASAYTFSVKFAAW